jgi:YrbI family 3-deoxy-D-manno-octulosonate 8-phosphate phosphatase
VSIGWRTIAIPSVCDVDRHQLVVAVIPARGGSKGLPGKNLAPVAGRPLVARAVHAAAAALHVDRVVVSTDDPLIADAARDAGAEVIERPAELAGDTATSESAVLHAIDVTAPHADVVVLVQSTSPFISTTDIDAVAAAVAGGRADCAFTAAPSHGFLWRPDGTGINHDPVKRARRQDRPVELLETGAAYAMTVAGLRRTGHRFFDRILPVAVDPARTLEIDAPADLRRARLLAALLDPAPDVTVEDLDAVVLDFDGTLTDDTVVVDQDGRESVTVHRGDGLGIAALRRAGLDVLILSTERNPVVAARARKLGIPALSGIDDKGTALAQWCADNGHSLRRTAYVGNDVNDLPCFQLVGWPIAVADAHHSVRARARIVTAARGGRGAVREFASRLLREDIRDGSEPLALHR